MQETRNLICSTNGKYLKLKVSGSFTYGRYSSEKDIFWAPVWVDSINDATDFGGIVEDVISWIHRFTSECVGRVTKRGDAEGDFLDKEELKAMSLAELRRLAAKNKVAGRSRMNKDDLRRALAKVY